MLRNHLHLFWRHARRQPVFATINIIGLAIGMAACILILLFIQEQVSYENMHSRAGDVYRVLTVDKALGTNDQRVGITQPALGANLADAFPEIEAASRLTFGSQTLLQLGTQPPVYAEELREADPDFFEFFDYPMIAGDRETALARPFSLVLTESLSRTIFGDDDPIGQSVRDGSGADFTITGVLRDLPANTHLTFDALGTMLTTASQARASQPEDSPNPIWIESWRMVAMPTYARFSPGASAEGFDERITQFTWDNGVPENFEITLQPLLDVHLGSTDVIFDPVQNKGDRNTVTIFAAIALLILLIAIVNYLNLSTARSTDRAREVGMRKMMGSTKSQLIVQFLSESVITAMTALVLAVALAWLTIPLLNNIAGSDVSINSGNVMMLGAFLLTLVVLVGIVAGIYPAFALSSFQPITVLRGSFKSSKPGRYIRVGLVVFQFALSIALIGMTGMVQKQLSFIQNMDMGYDRDQVMLFDMVDQTMQADQELFREQLRTNPDFVAVSTSGGVPGRSFGRTGLRPEGTSADDPWIWSQFAVGPETLPALGIEMALGRNFDANRMADETGAVLINETAVAELGWDNPLERRIFFGAQDSTGSEILGVVKDFHFAGIHQNIEPLVIQPLGQRAGGTVVARIQSGRVAGAVRAAEAVWASVYPDYPFTYSFMDEEFQQIYESDLATGKVINIFASLAILIACLGLFGLVSFSTTQRTKEIGVRKALGASSPSVIMLLILDFARWVVLANLIALPLAWVASSRWLSSFAYHVEVDIVVLGVASLVTLGIAVLTVVLQSWKAANTNPVMALRHE
jgi:putative ABC transport system permease protein